MDKKQKTIACLLGFGLISLTCIVYAQTVRFEFVDIDDDRYILENPTVRDGLSAENVLWAWATPYFSNWHPLTTLSWMLDVELFGVDAGKMHLTNALWHTANVVMLFCLFQMMTGRLWRSAAVAALFAVHPLHVESVAWISSRKDVLFQFFGLVALLSYVKYTQTSRFRWYAFSLAGYGASLLSKQMLVTFPFVLLLLDFWPLSRLGSWPGMPAKGERAAKQRPVLRRVLTEKLPFLALGIVFSLLIFEIQRRHGSVSDLERIPLGLRMSNIATAYVEYLGHAIWPTRLVVLYPFRQAWPSLLVPLAAAGLLVAISVIVFLQARRRPYLVTGWLWFLGTLVPVIGIIQVGSQRLADRYTYFPMIGIYFALVWLASDLLPERRGARILKFATCGLCLIVLTSMARHQVSAWRNGITLYRHALRCTPNNLTILGNLGQLLLDAGQTDEAMNCFQQAVRIAPHSPFAHSILATAYHRAGDQQRAAEHCRQSVLLGPRDLRVQYNAGSFYQDLGDNRQALECYARAIDSPGDPSLIALAHLNSGVIWFSMGEIEPARSHFRDALSMQPERNTTSKAMTNLGILEASQQNLELAADTLQTAIRVDPDNAHGHFYLGRVLLQQGHRAEALQALDAAVTLDPSFAADRESLLRE